MIEDVHIDEFVRKQRELHRRIRSEGIAWADTKPAPYRLLGVSAPVWFIAAGLAGLSWLMMIAQGL